MTDEEKAEEENNVGIIFKKSYEELEMKAEEDCKTYLCRECNRIFECDGNVAFCSKARTFCKNRLIELLREENTVLKKESESQKQYIESLKKLIKTCTLFSGDNNIEMYQLWKGIKMEIGRMTDEEKSEKYLRQGICQGCNNTCEGDCAFVKPVRKAYLDGLSEGRKENEQLKQQIEKMKCCGNCLNRIDGQEFKDGCKVNWDCEKYKQWECVE